MMWFLDLHDMPWMYMKQLLHVQAENGFPDLQQNPVSYTRNNFCMYKIEFLGCTRKPMPL